MTFSLRLLLPFLLFVPITILAQLKAQPCFFSEDFEGEDIPAGWDIGPWVERLTVNGDSIGEQVPAWRVGFAGDANAGGFFPVPDLPIWNKFIMANDDAPPCPCDMVDVRLTTPQLDFSGRTNVVLEFRAFHDMNFGGGEAFVEASPNGVDWYWLHSIPAVENQWQWQFVDMSAWSDPSVWIRFRWSDNGEWASGIAIDDVCLRERNSYDLSVINVTTGNDTVSAFNMGDQSLRYTMLPLEQAAPIAVSTEVINHGTEIMTNVILEGSISIEGGESSSFTSTNGIDLAPGERRTLRVNTGWTPQATGQLLVGVEVHADMVDEDPSDNTGLTTVRITGPGWENGYSAMALDDGIVQSSIGGTGSFVIGDRFELAHPGTPRSITAVIANGTEAGAEVRAVLMDVNFTLLDTSAFHTITNEDIEAGWAGEGIHLPFTSPIQRPAGDLFAGVQRMGAEGAVHLGVSGVGVIGSAFHMEGSSINVSYPSAIPMIRLHFSDYLVGITEQPEPLDRSMVYPNPMNFHGTLMIELQRSATIEIGMRDMLGRNVKEVATIELGAGRHELPLDLSGTPPGIYLLDLYSQGLHRSIRVVVTGR